MLRFHFFTAKQGTWVHKDDRGPSGKTLSLKIILFHILIFASIDSKHGKENHSGNWCSTCNGT